MASLALTFSDVYTKVSEFLGLGSSPSGSNLTKVQDITNRAYRKFLFPVSSGGVVHNWSFLKKEGHLSISQGTWKYDLPDDYRSMIVGPKKYEGANTRNPSVATQSKILGLHNTSQVEAQPLYYCVNTGAFDNSVGQRHEIWFWSIPDAAYNYTFVYGFEPKKLDVSTDVFIGGFRESEVILELALACAEQQEDDVAGTHSQSSAAMLDALIQWDVAHNISISKEADPDIQKMFPKEPAIPGA